MYLIPDLVDPFNGVIVWGTTGLIAWLALAAAAGIGLRILRESSRRDISVETPPTRETHEHFPEAA